MCNLDMYENEKPEPWSGFRLTKQPDPDSMNMDSKLRLLGKPSLQWNRNVLLWKQEYSIETSKIREEHFF